MFHKNYKEKRPNIIGKNLVEQLNLITNLSEIEAKNIIILDYKELAVDEKNITKLDYPTPKPKYHLC